MLMPLWRHTADARAHIQHSSDTHAEDTRTHTAHAIHTAVMEQWWAQIEAVEAGGAPPVAVEDEQSGDLCGDGSLLKTITKSGEPGPMPKKGSKVCCVYSVDHVWTHAGVVMDTTSVSCIPLRIVPLQLHTLLLVLLLLLLPYALQITPCTACIHVATSQMGCGSCTWHVMPRYATTGGWSSWF